MKIKKIPLTVIIGVVAIVAVVYVALPRNSTAPEDGGERQSGDTSRTGPLVFDENDNLDGAFQELDLIGN